MDLFVQRRFRQVFQTRSHLSRSCQRGRRTLCQRTVALIVFRIQVDSLIDLDIHAGPCVCERCSRTVLQRNIVFFASSVVFCRIGLCLRQDLAYFSFRSVIFDFRMTEYTGVIFAVHDRHAVLLFRSSLQLSRDRSGIRHALFTVHDRLFLVEGEGNIGNHILFLRNFFDHRLFHHRLLIIDVFLRDRLEDRLRFFFLLFGDLRHRDLIGFRFFDLTG